MDYHQNARLTVCGREQLPVTLGAQRLLGPQIGGDLGVSPVFTGLPLHKT